MTVPARMPRIAQVHLTIFLLLIATVDRGHAATPSVGRESILLNDLKQHVAFLASDTLEGRSAGTRGGHAAATYLAQQFRNLGLTPAGDDGDYFQEFGQGYRNILALLPGSQSGRDQEVIIVGAHFDHVGYGKSTNSYGPLGQIHNGADDNASGTAAILEVAEALALLEPSPQRTILFALWDAEEAGLLGSAHWVQHPTVPLERVRLVINADMVGRMRNDRVITYGCNTAAGLRRCVAFANQQSRLNIDLDPSHRDDSDHWTFFQRQIPYLMLHTGEHPDYHRPSDDVERLNYDGLHRLAQMMYDLTRIVADTDDLGSFRGGSSGEVQSKLVDAAPKPKPRLGLAWQQRNSPDEPFLVTHVVPDSPAAEAGLLEGDLINSIDGATPSMVNNLRDAVLKAESQVRLQIVRQGIDEPLDMTVYLRGHPVRLGVHWRINPDEPQTVIITSIVPGSPAARAGIQPNDRLYPPGNKITSGADWLQELVERSQDSITLHVDRAGQLQTIQIKLLPTPAT